MLFLQTSVYEVNSFGVNSQTRHVTVVHLSVGRLGIEPRKSTL